MKKLLVIGLSLLLVVGVLGYSLYFNSKDEEMEMKKEGMEEENMMEEKKDDSMMEEKKDDSMMEIMNDGELASSFSLMSIRGEEVSLEELKGDRVYIKFWASWCSICLSGMEELDELAGMSEDFKVYTIVSPGINGEQGEEDFIKWFKTLETKNIEVLLDPTGEVFKAYGVRAVPSSAYIGSDGVLVKFIPGHTSNEVVYSYFDEVK